MRTRVRLELEPPPPPPPPPGFPPPPFPARAVGTRTSAAIAANRAMRATWRLLVMAANPPDITRATPHALAAYDSDRLPGRRDAPRTRETRLDTSGPGESETGNRETWPQNADPCAVP